MTLAMTGWSMASQDGSPAEDDVWTDDGSMIFTRKTLRVSLSNGEVQYGPLASHWYPAGLQNMTYALLIQRSQMEAVLIKHIPRCWDKSSMRQAVND